MHLGDKLKLYRRSKDLDQVQTAELLSISTRTYQDIEKTGIVKRVTYLNAIRKLLAGDTKEPEGNMQEIAEKEVQLEKPLTRTEVSDLIRTNRMQAEAILNLSRNFNSGGSALTPSSGQAERTGIGMEDLPLSGKIKRGTKKKGI